MDKKTVEVTPEERRLITMIRQAEEGSIRVRIEDSKPVDVQTESKDGLEQDKLMISRARRGPVNIAAA